MHVIINIGRNIGDTPMDDGRWAYFKNLTLCAIDEAIRDYSHGSGVPQVHVFTGGAAWRGGSEQSASFQVWQFDELDMHTLREELRKLADTFGQEAIALTIAGTEFVTPS
jgi:hypothetical protein